MGEHAIEPRLTAAIVKIRSRWENGDAVFGVLSKSVGVGGVSQNGNAYFVLRLPAVERVELFESLIGDLGKIGQGAGGLSRSIEPKVLGLGHLPVQVPLIKFPVRSRCSVLTRHEKPEWNKKCEDAKKLHATTALPSR